MLELLYAVNFTTPSVTFLPPTFAVANKSMLDLFAQNVKLGVNVIAGSFSITTASVSELVQWVAVSVNVS